uniref:Peptidase_S8 domain-containing protein n=1 Tax=Heterorhabditis bacteriophora TaxID=37862 RepID=A0A1I7WYS8_HETBA
MALISLQALQLKDQSLDFPLSYVMNDVHECPRFTNLSRVDDHPDNLKPSSIAIYADIGHLATYCKTNYTLLKAGILDSCDHHSSTMELPSMDKILRVFNPNLTVVKSNERDDFLPDQARMIAYTIKQSKGYNNIWKLIVIAATIQDGEASETGQTAIEVLDTIEELYKLLPEKTFIVVLRSSGNGLASREPDSPNPGKYPAFPKSRKPGNSTF